MAGMVVALALLLSAAFGAGDQYLGSLPGSGHLWALHWSTDISLLSAPWLVLPCLRESPSESRGAPHCSASPAPSPLSSATA